MITPEKAKKMNESKLRDTAADLSARYRRLDNEFPWEQHRELEKAAQEKFVVENEIKNRNKVEG